MKKYLLFGLVVWSFLSQAQNPIITNLYTADPAALVYGDSVYLYTGHDEASQSDNFYRMNDWRVFSSGDMLNWNDHGEVLSIATFSWAKSNAWASHTVERDGKFYWYVTVSPKSGGAFAIGVAVADSPTGPFTDAIGAALITDNMTPNLVNDIDPAVFIDDDGQAYLYWGNGGVCKVVKLKENMIEMDGAIKDISPAVFTEAAYMHKRNDIYYLTYAGNWPETIEYATGNHPMGPFTHHGKLNALTSSTTNHQSIIEFKDQWYFIYHTAELSGGGDYRRSVAIEYLYYNDDNTIQEIVQTQYGVASTDVTLLCPPISITPNLKVNNEAEKTSRELSLVEGDDLVLSPEAEANGSWLWEGPNNFSDTSREITFNSLTIGQSGVYLAIFTNDCGTRSYISYTVNVNFSIPENIQSGRTYVIRALGSDKVVSVENNERANGANIIVANNENSPSQRFVFTLVEDVYWKITPANSPGRGLDVFNISNDDGANIVIWEYWGGAGQQWQITEPEAGIYHIISRNSGKYLDVNPSNNNIRQWSFQGDVSQQFTIEDYDDTNAVLSPGNKNEIKVYPVPATSENLVVKLPKQKGLKEITLVDLHGAVIYKSLNFEGDLYRPGFKLSSGVYFVKVKTNQSIYTQKVIIE